MSRATSRLSSGEPSLTKMISKGMSSVDATRQASRWKFAMKSRLRYKVVTMDSRGGGAERSGTFIATFCDPYYFALSDTHDAHGRPRQSAVSVVGFDFKFCAERYSS